MHFDNIVVTTDFSGPSIKAFEWAAYQAKMEGTKVTLLTVISDWEVPISFYQYLPEPDKINQYRTEMISAAEKKLRDLIGKYFHGQKVIPQVISSSKNPAEEICDYAAKSGCNLIVASSQGKGALGHLFLGSTVESILKIATCPVLVVPTHK